MRTELPPEKQEVQALPDDRIIELAEMGGRIEAYYGPEQDIEWCLADGKLYVLQSRPITSLYPVPQVPDGGLHVFISIGHPQMMTDAMRPLGISVMKALQGPVKPGSEILYEAGGRLFADLTSILALKPARKAVPGLMRLTDEAIAAALTDVVKRPDFHPRPDYRLLVTGTLAAVPILFRAVKSLLIGDPARARHRVKAFMEQSVRELNEQLRGAPGPERVRRIRDSLGNTRLRLFTSTVPYAVIPGMVSSGLIGSLSRRWLGERQGADMMSRLNKSLPGNITTEMSLMVGDLADVARIYPEVVDYLQRAKDETFYEGLRNVSGGPAFQHELDRFMDRYGMRCPGELDITNPRWKESPTMLVPMIISHIRTAAPGEHRERFRRGELEAGQAARQILSDVSRQRFGFLKQKVMSRLIRVYRGQMGLREYPKYIIMRYFWVYKQGILEEAGSLARKGLLSNGRDVFYLSLDELLALEEGCFSGDARELVEARKWQYVQYQKLTPPRVMTSEGEVITGRKHDVRAPEGALAGTPVSAGVVEGIARIVLRPQDARLNPGEILVAPFTDPGWTPLFNSAKGLVVEVGGVMTHGSVVAREYGIPAVTGVEKATQIIRNGDRIRVDGTRGFVQVLGKD